MDSLAWARPWGWSRCCRCFQGVTSQILMLGEGLKIARLISTVSEIEVAAASSGDVEFKVREWVSHLPILSVFYF
jgi:hypothetical protein